MTGASISPILHHEAGACAGRREAASDLSFWLGLAAAPTFAVMGLWSALSRSQPDLLCMAMQSSSPIGGMTVMYLLMGAFHMAPWLRLISDRLKGSAERLS